MIKICQKCETEYSTDNKHRKYCSSECAYADRGGKIETQCEFCGQIFLARRSRLSEGFDKYCGQFCMAQAMVTRTERQCEYCGDTYSIFLSRAKTNRFCSVECKDLARTTRVDRPCDICGEMVSAIPWKLERGWGRYCSKECQGIGSSGENHYNWKGGITPKNVAIRSSQKYLDWRKTVYARDNFACQDCGAKDITLHAHHIFPFAEFPEHRFDVWNGITLCEPCHMKTHFGVNAMETTH